MVSEQVDVVQVGLASTLLPEVQKAMTVERYADGATKSGFLAVFEGRLTVDPEGAFSRLEEVFHRAGVQLMSASEGGQDVLYAVPAMPAVKPSNPWVNLGLFALTVFSVLLAGTLYGYSGAPDLKSLISALPTGIPFAASLLAILLAHEFGHYLAARYHKAPVSLPYFLPFPGSVFGTMGAFIRLKRPPRNRNVLLDIGLSGPLAGLVVAIPILLYGLSISQVGPLPSDPRALAGLEGNSVLYLLAKYLVTGMWLPSPASHGDLPLLLYWLRYILLGQPLPLGGTDVYLSPIAWAGWAGLLVTALNLIPAGQLDGGHLVYVLLGPKAIKLWPAIVALTLLLGLVWSGWFLWAGLIFLLGRTFARPLDDITPLTPWRKAMAYFGLLVFVLVFTPVPLR
jgi:membrane-associated protease RseP (regulator of RpoE activity)